MKKTAEDSGLTGVRGAKLEATPEILKFDTLLGTVGMAGESATESPGLWLRQNRLAAGYKTQGALAHKLGASPVQVYQWERGAERPRARYMRKLRSVLRLPLKELVWRLWREKLGGPAPCGCGELVFPTNPNTFMCDIRVPCQSQKSLRCKKERLYSFDRRHRNHRKVCNACVQLKPRDKYTCVGYRRFGKSIDYGPKCHRIEDLLLSEVNQRKQNKINKINRPPPWYRKTRKPRKYPNLSWERPFINESLHTYRCQSCALASHAFALQTARLESLSGEKIRTGKQYRQLWFDYREELGMKAGRGAKHFEEMRKNTPKNRMYGERHRENTSRGRIIAKWQIPPKLTVSLCLYCDTFNYRPAGQTPAQFHGPCLNRLLDEGRSPADFRSHKPGPSVDFENLKKYHTWAVRHCLTEESLRDVGKNDHRDWSYVKDRVGYVLARLPAPDKVPRRFRKFVSLLREATSQKTSFDAEISLIKPPQTRSQSGGEG